MSAQPDEVSFPFLLAVQLADDAEALAEKILDAPNAMGLYHSPRRRLAALLEDVASLGRLMVRLAGGKYPDSAAVVRHRYTPEHFINLLQLIGAAHRAVDDGDLPNGLLAGLAREAEDWLSDNTQKLRNASITAHPAVHSDVTLVTAAIERRRFIEGSPRPEKRPPVPNVGTPPSTDAAPKVEGDDGHTYSQHPLRFLRSRRMASSWPFNCYSYYSWESSVIRSPIRLTRRLLSFLWARWLY